MALAKTTTIAGSINSPIPIIMESETSLKLFPFKSPQINDIIKKHAPISTINQSYLNTPNNIIAKVDSTTNVTLHKMKLFGSTFDFCSSKIKLAFTYLFGFFLIFLAYITTYDEVIIQ